MVATLFGLTTNPKLGLERMGHLLSLINSKHPPRGIVQVVGTNGKGSTVALVESMLRAANIGVGLFTSPHLCTVRERIRINGQTISEDELVASACYVLDRAHTMQDQPSFFECMLAMALKLFSEHKVEVAILEAGLGGRLDATTAANASVLGVTMIDFDHQNILGATIEEIAKEKMGAARKGQTVVTVSQAPKVRAIIHAHQRAIGFDLLDAPLCHRPLALFGDHQKANAGLAIELVHSIGIKLDSAQCDQGLREVNWPGRFEIVPGEEAVVLDGAHNPSGISCLIESLRFHPMFIKRPLVVVYGSLKSEHAYDKVRLLANSGLNIARIYVHQSDNERALTVDDLRNLFGRAGVPGELVGGFYDWSSVLAVAKQLSAAVVICGSLYTVGALRSAILGIPMDKKVPNF